MPGIARLESERALAHGLLFRLKHKNEGRRMQHLGNIRDQGQPLPEDHRQEAGAR